MRTPLPAPRPSADRSRRSRRRARRLLLAGVVLVVLWLTACEDVPGTEIAVSVKDGVAVVAGTDQQDLIVLRLRAGDPGTIDVDVDLDGVGEFEIDRSAVHTLALKGYGGDDALVIDGSNGGFTDTERTLMAGGAGADTLIGGNGADWLAGGPDDDVLTGAQGADTLLGDDGNDRFVWNPGDSSDSVTGGAGSDRVTFSGDDSDEAFDISPLGNGHVRVARSVANVILDVDGVEAVDLRARRGADTVYVSDVTGTGLTSVGVDLSASSGGDDTHADAIVAASPDVAIGRDGAAATVTGLGAQVRVTGGATNDEIRVAGPGPDDRVEIDGTGGPDQVNVVASTPDVALFGATPGLFVRLVAIESVDVDLGNGADVFTSVGNIAALTHLDVDGQGGSDTLTGSNGADVLTGGSGTDTIDGQQGADTIAGVGGDDTFQWDPGDGSDVYTGGTGADRFVMNGSNANENYAVEALDDGHVRLTRDVAAIVHDLNEIEALELNVLGGADSVNVPEVAGTHLTSITPNLAAFGGGDDGQQDSVVVPPGKPITRDAAGLPTVGGLGVQLQVVNGVLGDRVHVLGTGGSDVVPVVGTDGADGLHVVANGTEVVVQTAPAGPHVSTAAVEKLDIDALGGDDFITGVGNLAALISIDVDAGPGADTIWGSNGADLLVGGPGADSIDGQQGADTLVGGDQDDTFQWDPGDGSDLLDGDAGSDRFVVNGSAGNELFGVSAMADGKARFTRNIGNVIHDFDDIEAFELRSLAGVDTFHVADLHGTDLVSVTSDLAPVGGGDDGQPDNVVVASTGTVISRDGATPIVEGRGAQVRVVGGSPSDFIQVTGAGEPTDRVQVLGTPGADNIAASSAGTDVAIEGATPGIHVRLTSVATADIDLGEGSDQFSGVGNLAALITLDVDGGGGDDDLRGGNGADLLVGGPGADTLDGNQGADTIDAGTGADVVQWDPGDGSDAINGGSGLDQLLFNGSADNEIFGLSPAGGGRVTLTRNVGNVVLDLAQIDRIDLLTRDGSDQVFVDPLVGTTLSELVVDLAAQPGGSADPVTDQLVYSGTAGDDNLLVFDDGADVVVQGGQPTLRVRGASPIDGLVVQGLAGNDVINATPGAHALMALTLLP